MAAGLFALAVRVNLPAQPQPPVDYADSAASHEAHLVVNGLYAFTHYQAGVTTEWPGVSDSISNNGSILTPSVLRDMSERVLVHRLQDPFKQKPWEAFARDRSTFALGRVGLRYTGWQEESPSSGSGVEAGFPDLLVQTLIIEQCPYLEGSLHATIERLLHATSRLPTSERLNAVNAYRSLPISWWRMVYHINLLHSPTGISTVLCEQRGTAAGCARWGTVPRAIFSAKGFRESRGTRISPHCALEFHHKVYVFTACAQSLHRKHTHTMRPLC